MRKKLFKIISRLKRWLIKHSTDSRPSSEPYLSGDSFRKISDYIYDETGKFDPTLVKKGQIIFLKSDLIEDYFNQCHPKINNPYKLITHNSDRNITSNELRWIDDKIIHWFAQNVTVEHPRLTPIPIGLENKHYCQNGLISLFDKLRQKVTIKKMRILYGFSVGTNPQERQSALESLRKTPTADKIEGFPIPPKYLKELSLYSFVASPVGNGLDCHRTWEAMYLGVIPIVKKSIAMNYFGTASLPLWTIDEWSELESLSEENLAELAKKIRERGNQSRIWFSYWKKLIQEA